MADAGGQGTALVVDHEDPAAVADLVARIEAERGRLDVLVNDIFGGDRYAQWHTPLWEHDLAGGLRMLRMGVDTHLITAHAALPLLLLSDRGLLVEMTDGTAEVNANYREGVGFFYDLVKANVGRIILALAHELRDGPVTALGVTPGWLRSEAMLEGFGVTEEPWRDALARFRVSRSRSHRRMSPAGSPPSPRTRRWPSSPVRSSPPASWPTATASPIPTAHARTPGATSPSTAWRNRAERTSSGSADRTNRPRSRPWARNDAGTVTTDPLGIRRSRAASGGYRCEESPSSWS